MKREPPQDRLFQGEQMSFTTYGSLVVVLHTSSPPDDLAWNTYLEAARSVASSNSLMQTLVFTDGGAPNADQRRPLMALFRGLNAPVAVVSNVAGVRFVGSSIAILGLKIKGY